MTANTRPPSRTVQLAGGAGTATALAVLGVVVAAAVAVLLGRPAGDAASGADRAASPVVGVVVPPTPVAPATTRLALMGPVPLGDEPVAPGAAVELSLPELAPRTSSVLVGVTLRDATGPGAVSVGAEAHETVALRLAKAGAQTSATTVAPVGPDGRLRVRTEGGGRLAVSLVGAFAPAGEARDGRVVVVPTTEVVHLVPETGGKDARAELSTVPAIREAGTVSAVVVHLGADVGPRGGFVAAGAAPDRLDQTVYWSATAGEDRFRTGLLVVPVTDGSLHLHYEAGRELHASVVGYVTGPDAPRSREGLLVVPPPRPLPPVAVAPGASAPLPLASAGDPVPVPAGRITAVLAGLTATATGEAPGGVAVHAGDAPAPASPTLTAAAGANRATATLVAAADGAARVTSESGATVTVTPQALVITGG